MSTDNDEHVVKEGDVLFEKVHYLRGAVVNIILTTVFSPITCWFLIGQITTILNQRYSIHVGTSDQKQDRLNNRIKRGELLTIHFLMPV